MVKTKSRKELFLSKASYKNMLSNVHFDPERKSWPRMIFEALQVGLCHSEIPKFYFTRFLYRKDCYNIDDYMSTYKNVGKIHRSKKIHNPCIEEILENKLFFSLFFADKKIPTPKLRAYNLGQVFYAQDQAAPIKSHEELVSFFEKHVFAGKAEQLFVKPVHGSGGGDHYKLDLDSLRNQPELFDKFKKSNYIFQETIVQHPLLAKIFAGSVNTIRLVSYLDEGEVQIIGGYFRFGRGQAVVDNGCAGGGSVGFDLKTGVLRKEAIQLLESGGNAVFDCHPETGVAFENFELPFYKEAIQLIKETISVLPAKLAGWDIAITAAGPVLIEGNHDFHYGLCEIMNHGTAKDPIFRKILREANEE